MVGRTIRKTDEMSSRRVELVALGFGLRMAVGRRSPGRSSKLAVDGDGEDRWLPNRTRRYSSKNLLRGRHTFQVFVCSYLLALMWFKAKAQFRPVERVGRFPSGRKNKFQQISSKLLLLLLRLRASEEACFQRQQQQHQLVERCRRTMQQLLKC